MSVLDVEGAVTQDGRDVVAITSDDLDSWILLTPVAARRLAKRILNIIQGMKIEGSSSDDVN